MSYVTLEEAKDHCRIDYTDDDSYVSDLISVAETAVLNELEAYSAGPGTVTTAGTTTLTGTTDDESATKFLDYKVGDKIKVSGESERTIATIANDYTLTVTSAFSTSDSELSYEVEPSPLVASALPTPIKQAILMVIGHLYNQREPVVISVSAVKIPFTLEYLLAPYKYWVCR